MSILSWENLHYKFDCANSTKDVKDANNCKKCQVPGLEWSGNFMSSTSMSWDGRFRFRSGISTMGGEALTLETISVSKEVNVNWACNSSTWERMASTSSCCWHMAILCWMRISRMNVTWVDKSWTVIWRCCRELQRSSVLSNWS